MLIPRRLTEQLHQLSKFFPVVTLTGPRQVGKTTLLRELYPGYAYVSLEQPNTRLRAQEDPIAFLQRYNDRVIFDEAQLKWRAGKADLPGSIAVNLHTGW